jgi:hypothetical protein
VTEDATLTITLLTLILLPFASALLAALLALRDGGLVAWEWVRILLIASLFLALQIVLPGHAPWAVSIAMVMVLAFQVAGFYAWRIFGTGVPSDGT